MNDDTMVYVNGLCMTYDMERCHNASIVRLKATWYMTK